MTIIWVKIQGPNQMKQLDLWGHRRPSENGRYKSSSERWIGANQKVEREWVGRGYFSWEHNELKELKGRGTAAKNARGRGK